MLVDIAIAVIACVGFVRGWLTGLLRQAAGLMGFVLGIWLASALCARLGDYLRHLTGASQTLGRVVAFILIWVCVPLVLVVLARLLARLLKAINLGFLDRIGGALLGAAKYTLMVSVLFNVLDAVKVLPADGEVAVSRLYVPVTGLTSPLFDSICEHGTAVMKSVGSFVGTDAD